MASPKTIRRAYKIWQQVKNALYPFTEDSLLSGMAFNNKGEIVRPQEYYETRFRLDQPSRRSEKPHLVYGKLSFLATTLKELPPETVRRFFWDPPGKSEPEPTDEEFEKFRRLLLGTTRRR